MATKLDIIHGYRHLYRGLLRAVHFSPPARYITRDQLRAAFHEPDAVWNPEGVKRTIWFLEAATRERGLEHRILKNLIQVRVRRKWAVRHWKRNLHDSKQKNELQEDKNTASQHYDMTVAMLNKSMGLCLR